MDDAVVLKLACKPAAYSAALINAKFLWNQCMQDAVITPSSTSLLLILQACFLENQTRMMLTSPAVQACCRFCRAGHCVSPSSELCMSNDPVFISFYVNLLLMLQQWPFCTNRSTHRKHKPAACIRVVYCGGRLASCLTSRPVGLFS